MLLENMLDSGDDVFGLRFRELNGFSGRFENRSV